MAARTFGTASFRVQVTPEDESDARELLEPLLNPEAALPEEGEESGS
jgi:hypothetical protein